MKWEENVRRVVPYTPGEQPKKSGVIKLNTNENPYPPAPGVGKALAALDVEKFKLYPEFPEQTELAEALAARYQIATDQIFIGVGSDDVLSIAFMTFFQSDKPVFSRISPILSTTCGRMCTEYPMRGRRWTRIFRSVRQITASQTAA